MRTIEAHPIRKTVNGRTIETGKFRVTVPASDSAPKHRRQFKTRELADAFARRVNEERCGRIEELYRLDRASQALLLHALKRAGSAQAVLDAVNAAGDPLRAKTVREAIDALIQDRQDAGRSKAYISALKWTLNSFAVGRNEVAISNVATKDVRDWLGAIGGTPDMRRAYITRIRGLFTFAQEPSRKWCRENPAKGISMPDRSGREPVVLTVAQCKTLLATCIRSDAGMIRYFVLCLFAGMRPSEARRLRPEHIREKYIYVPKKIAVKSRDARNIEIGATLRVWLNAGGEFPVPKNWKKRFQAIVKAAGFNWRDYQDSMRHTFVTNSCVLHGWEKTVEAAGHSLAMMSEHYRAASITKTEAEEFWALTPETVF